MRRLKDALDWLKDAFWVALDVLAQAASVVLDFWS